ncbi:glycosyltransferase family 2 protein [Nostoc sp. CCY0012]|uniref:glycosyltransferase family 2 protein n=1 Tax=Nostoc sp. CCY0012 TaxID=1056123 RepID=UPI0039C6E2AD
MINSQESVKIQPSSNLDDTPLVSIIIGNYNYEKFVGQAINSALNQTYPNIEVIVVDDGSQDKSREVINQYGNQVIPIFKENGGQPSNYNIGFAKSKGEIICFLDSDDIFLSDKVEKVVKAFQSSLEIGWCFHSIQLIDENNNPLPVTTTPNYVTRECDFRQMVNSGKLPYHLPPCSGLCFKRELLEKILPMPCPKKVTNNDYYVKYMSVALSKGFILNDDLTLQKIHNNNAATLRQDRHEQKSRKYIYTAMWVKQEFPKFCKLANKLMAIGLDFNRKDGNKNDENNQLIQNYMNSISLAEKIEINFIALYYLLRDLVKNKLFFIQAN